MTGYTLVKVFCKIRVSDLNIAKTNDTIKQEKEVKANEWNKNTNR